MLLFFFFSECIIYDTSTCKIELQPRRGSEYSIKKLIEIHSKDIEPPDFYIDNGIKYPVTSLDIESFADKEFETIFLGKNIKFIFTGAFQNCLKLASADLSNTKITTLPHYIFYMCVKLKLIKLPPNVCEIQSFAFSGSGVVDFEFIPSIKNIDKNSFSSSLLKCADLSKTRIDTIPPFAFYKTSYLEKCILPSSCNKIEDSAFAYSNIKFFSGFQYLEILDEFSFFETNNLHEVDLSQSKIKIIKTGALQKLGAVILPPFLEEIHYKSMMKTSLSKILRLPDTVKVLQNGAFFGTKDVEIFDLSNLNITIIPNNLLSWSSVNEVILPNTIKQICHAAFYQSGLECININSQVEIIESMVFANCKIKEIDLSKTQVRSLPRFVFLCTPLQKIHLPHTLSFLDRKSLLSNNNSPIIYYYGKQSPLAQRPLDDFGHPIVHVPMCYSGNAFFDIPVIKDLECIDDDKKEEGEEKFEEFNSFGTVSEIDEEETYSESQGEPYGNGDLYLVININMILALIGITFVLIVICSACLLAKASKYSKLSIYV